MMGRFLFMMVGLWAVLAWAAPCPGQTLGEEAPDFTYINLEGETCSLSDHRGKIVLVDFFSSWWLASRNNLVNVENLQREYAYAGVEVICLARDDMETLKAFVEERPGDVSFTLGMSVDAARMFRVGYIPHMFIVDPMGRLYWQGEPEGGPNSLHRLQLQADYALSDLVYDWPDLLRERGQRDFREAFELALGGATLCEQAEGYCLLHEVADRYDPVPEVAGSAAALIAILEAGRAGALLAGLGDLAQLTWAAEAVDDRIRAEGSLLSQDQAAKYMESLKQMAREAGARTGLAKSIKSRLFRLEARLAGKGFLGVQFNRSDETRGAVILQIIEGTAAEKSGLRAGDLIRKMDGLQIASLEEVHAFLDHTVPGQEISLVVQRQGKDELVALDVVLGIRIQ